MTLHLLINGRQRLVSPFRPERLNETAQALTEQLPILRQMGRVCVFVTDATNIVHPHRRRLAMDFKAGDLVEAEHYTAAFIQGDRYGTVVEARRKHTGHWMVFARMDMSGRLRRFSPPSLKHLTGQDHA